MSDAALQTYHLGDVDTDFILEDDQGSSSSSRPSTSSEGRRSSSSSNRSRDSFSASTPPPPYKGFKYEEYKATGKGLTSTARVGSDGRISISLDLKKVLPELPEDYARDVKEFAVDEEAGKTRDVPVMNVVIMIVGSRGDVQPYLALAKRLIQDGHRVRIATHEIFRSFVQSAPGVEFASIGGDPQDLMSYMVKNPGLMPGIDSLTNGDIGRKRKMLTEMITGCWRACYEPDSSTGRTFAADAIISNPPAFAHVHCAQALGAPVLLSFTMPWSPTKAFPHPLVNLLQTNAEQGLSNYLSYTLAELLTWQGVGDIINTFRVKTLGLPPLSLRSGPGLADRIKVPYTYCLSPALVPKPGDWKNHIDVVGFYFLDLASEYQPPRELREFLDGGPPPVYIGFGSVVVDDPEGMTDTIHTALQRTSTRAILSAGWGGLFSSPACNSDPNIFVLGKEQSVPHDWLFEHVAAVVHHGGAGTTAAGLRCGKPTVVVPFFGDQAFWGMMIHKSGAGPKPIPQKKLDVETLMEAIRYCLSAAAKGAAERMGEQIRSEDGVERGVESFYRHLPLLNMRCDLDPKRLAVWWSTKYCLRLSAFAAQVLVDGGTLKLDELDSHRPKEYETRKNISDPVTGGGSAIFWTVTHYYGGIAQIFYNPVKGIVNTTTAIPRGVMDIICSVHEGFHNIPRLYGSEVREHGKVTGFKSGIMEAGKSVFFGYYDGITGLVREPVEGAKKEGFVGAIKGSARSFVNATMKPAAGIMGAVAHPIQGTWKALQKGLVKKQEQQQRTTRVSDGVEAVRNSTASQREAILANFRKAERTTEQRQAEYKEAARKVLEGDEGVEAIGPLSKSEGVEPMSPGSKPPLPPRPPPYEAHSRSSSRSIPKSVLYEDEDAVFERELEMAKQLSLAEQRGYERGLESALRGG